MMTFNNNFKNTALKYFCNSYLLWFESIVTKNRLPFSHFIFIFFLIQNHYFKVLYVYVIVSISIGFITDFILKKKGRTKTFSDFLKRYSDPKLFEIFGNPGEAAAAKLMSKALGNKVVLATGVACTGALCCDHVCTHAGVYDSLSYKMNTAAGIDGNDALARMADRNSALDSLIKKDPNEIELDRLKSELQKLKDAKKD